MVQKIPDSFAPCGVYCGACPSFKISCNGCGSEDKNQKRKSKWSCKIRVCCFEKKNFNFCYEFQEFPCKEYSKKLSESHKGDKKFNYYDFGFGGKALSIYDNFHFFLISSGG